MAKQDQVSTSRNEGVTPGYETVDLNGGFGLANGITLRTGILNIFDAYYWDHLNARNPFTSQPVPEPGRVVFVDLAWAF